MSLICDLDPAQGVKAAGGILIQALPDANDHILTILEDRLATLSKEQWLGEPVIPIRDLADTLLEGLHPVKLASTELSYRCHCSHERLKRILAALPQSDLLEMAESDSDTEMLCRFCTKPYVFSRDEIRSLIRA